MKIVVRGNPAHITLDESRVLGGLKFRAANAMQIRQEIDFSFRHDDSLDRLEAVLVLVTDTDREDLDPSEFAEHLGTWLDESMSNDDLEELSLRIEVKLGKREGTWIRL